MKTILKRRMITAVLLLAFAATTLAHWLTDWKVGDRVEAFNVSWYKVTILEIGTGVNEGNYLVAYDGFGKASNNWIKAKNIRPIADPEKIPVTGPRMGLYLVRSYVGKSVIPQGNLEIRSAGRYRVYSPGEKLLGEGTYEYLPKTQAVKWLTGIYFDEKRGGRFEVERQGKSHHIFLNRTTLAENSRKD